MVDNCVGPDLANPVPTLAGQTNIEVENDGKSARMARRARRPAIRERKWAQQTCNPCCVELVEFTPGRHMKCVAGANRARPPRPSPGTAASHTGCPCCQACLCTVACNDNFSRDYEMRTGLVNQLGDFSCQYGGNSARNM